MLEVEPHESSLGRWTHAHWSPDAGTDLHGRVCSIWYFDGVLFARRQRLFPDGTIEIIVQLDEPHRADGHGVSERFPPVCVTGLRLTSEVIIAPPGRCRVLGIVITPPCAHLVMRESLAPLTALTADLHDIIGAAASELAERAHAAADPAAAIRVARSWLSERLARETNRKSTFRDVFGTTPKRYQRVLRFNRALREITHGASLADIAAAHGYYDQAHFTNEFREHSGMAPSVYLRSSCFPGVPSLAEE